MATEPLTVDADARLTEAVRMLGNGREIIISVAGRPAAKLVPLTDGPMIIDRQVLLARLRSQAPREIGAWTRGDLYDECV